MQIKFRMCKGMRHLSSYFCHESYSIFMGAILNFHAAKKMLSPKIAPGEQRVGLLHFADDLLFFLHINDKTLVNLTRNLQLFEEEAGQRINKSKSQLLFSKNIPYGLARHTRDILPISRSITSFD